MTEKKWHVRGCAGMTERTWIPACAGMTERTWHARGSCVAWIPACAGMTEKNWQSRQVQSKTPRGSKNDDWRPELASLSGVTQPVEYFNLASNWLNVPKTVVVGFRGASYIERMRIAPLHASTSTDANVRT
jgi:hypothetical protein